MQQASAGREVSGGGGIKRGRNETGELETESENEEGEGMRGSEPNHRSSPGLLSEAHFFAVRS